MRKGIFFLCLAVLVSCRKENSLGTLEPLEPTSFLNISYGVDNDQKMDIYLPKGRTTDKTKWMVLVHGGGWISGDKADFTPYIPVLQQKLPDYAIANINYHLATSTANHFPTQETDMKAAVDFLVQKSTGYNVSQNFVLLGASAGGHLVSLQAYKYPAAGIKAVVNFYGPVNMTALYNSIQPLYKPIIETLMGGTPTSNATLYEQSSPIRFVTAQAPPTILFHGDKDELVPVMQSQELKSKLQSVGVSSELTVYPGLGHDLWPEATMNDAFQKIEVFLKTRVP